MCIYQRRRENSSFSRKEALRSDDTLKVMVEWIAWHIDIGQVQSRLRGAWDPGFGICQPEHGREILRRISFQQIQGIISQFQGVRGGVGQYRVGNVLTEPS